MSNKTEFSGMTRRKLVTSAALAAVGAGTVLGAVPLSSEEASASVDGIAVEDVSVAGEEGRLASLTFTPDITTEWSDLSRSAEKLEIDINVNPKVREGGGGGRVATLTTSDISGTSGSYTHNSDPLDLLEVVEADVFHDDTEDGEPRKVYVDIVVKLEFYDANGEPFGPAPVSRLEFLVSVNNVEEEEDRCTADPQFCEGVSVHGSLNTDASAENPTE